MHKKQEHITTPAAFIRKPDSGKYGSGVSITVKDDGRWQIHVAVSGNNQALTIRKTPVITNFL